MRSREDDWQATEDDAQAAGLNTTTLIAHGMEVMQGYLRCHRGDCNADAPPVPVMFGDLTGKTLGEWVIAAVNLAVSQHPNHEPVWIGAPNPGSAPGPDPVLPCSWSPAPNRTSPPSPKSRSGTRRGDGEQPLR